MNNLGEKIKKANNSLKGLQRQFTHVVAFRPTGWTFTKGTGGAAASQGLFLPESEKNKPIVNVVSKGDMKVYGVPYSEHSSFGELVECLVKLRPNSIIPTVNVKTSSQQIETLMAACRQHMSS